MTNVFDVISSEFRKIIMEELKQRDPILFNELNGAATPTNEQSDAVVDTLYRALTANFGPGHIPNEYGKIIDNAIGAYLLAWPIVR